MAGTLKPFGFVPGTRVSLLSAPSKMPGFSFGTTAGLSCPGAHYGENAICSDCYAKKGRYIFGVVRRAQRTRFEWARLCMRSQLGRDQFTGHMTDTIGEAEVRYPRGYLRIHDSGDFFNPAYVRCWTQICAALPHMQFWAPTRSYRLLFAPLLYQLAALPNVTVRPSALLFGEAPPIIDGLAAGSGAAKTGYNCPASQQNNACGDCRSCWTDKEKPIVYKLH
jgi:hypothetical protein